MVRRHVKLMHGDEHTTDATYSQGVGSLVISTIKLVILKHHIPAIVIKRLWQISVARAVRTHVHRL